MKKTLSFLLAACLVFASFVFVVSAEEEYEEYDGMLCVKDELLLTSTEFVNIEDYEGEGPFDFFGVSIIKIEIIVPHTSTVMKGEKEDYLITIAPEVDIYEAKSTLEQNERILEVSFNPISYPAIDDTETPIEFTETVMDFGYEELTDIGIEPTRYGEGFEPIVVGAKEDMDRLIGCFDASDAKDFAKYDEAFFETKSLILVCAIMPDHGYSFEIFSLEYDVDGNIVFDFRCTQLWVSAPDEARTALVMAEVDKAVIEDSTGVKAEFELFSEQPGDANYDGIVDSADYLVVKRAAFGTYTLNEEKTYLVDINYDSAIDSADYAVIKRLAFGEKYWEI